VHGLVTNGVASKDEPYVMDQCIYKKLIEKLKRPEILNTFFRGTPKKATILNRVSPSLSQSKKGQRVKWGILRRLFEPFHSLSEKGVGYNRLT
jgi:hypothetical protein